MNKYHETLRYLYNLKNRGIKLDLNRVYRFQEELGYPDQAYNTIHIAGTNGKGSTAHFLSAMLAQGNLNVGLYTSPHLVRFNERVRINGRPVPDEFIVAFIQQWQPFLDEYELTYFEATTLLAMSYFRERGVNIAILETGLGGRLDATNIVTPIVSVITSIGLEHTDQLGDTLEAIAREKAGIIKPGIPCVVGQVPDAAIQVIARQSNELDAPLIIARTALQLQNIQVLKSGNTQFEIIRDGHSQQVSLRMVGQQAVQNAGIAIAALQEQDHYNIPWEQQQESLEQVTIPGRLQQLSETPVIYYDVAHNYDGLAQLIDNLQILYPNREVRFLLSLSELKDISRLAEIFPEQVPLGIMTIDSMPMHTINEWKKNLPAHTIRDLGQNCKAVEQFLQSLEKEAVGVIAGSYYIAQYVYQVFNFSLDS